MKSPTYPAVQVELQLNQRLFFTVSRKQRWYLFSSTLVGNGGGPIKSNNLATFQITLNVPSELTALSNMPVVHEKLNGHLKTGLRFFSKPYTLPKLDMVAVPDFPYGAMENYGLITYRESKLLYDNLYSTAVNK
ncbi:Aminopeptidase M1-B [Camellia lanceoleosa]|uniref:Aminopeptidase M1-B n=1 Tax=Camellia lanceoleosa TaxID=1840588 RepID=A0ACC0I1H1_9ERIC|nr:Aminopeptidase M1-B [Camellia lanceoleosa]